MKNVPCMVHAAACASRLAAGDAIRSAVHSARNSQPMNACG